MVSRLVLSIATASLVLSACPGGGTIDIGGPCGTHEECHDSAAPFCDRDNGVCVACLDDEHCGVGRECVGFTCQDLDVCHGDEDCPEPEVSYCDLNNGVCVACLDDEHCGEERVCTDFRCVDSQVPPVSGRLLNDWDYDGITDLAVYHPAESAWYIRMSGGNQDLLPLGFRWGPADSVPVPGRFDDSGLPTLALYHPFSGEWHVRLGNGDEKLVHLGGYESQPIPGDFTGNGISDLCVFDHSSKLWTAMTVSGETLFEDVHWGHSGVIPIAGDFNGDGRFDLAIFDPGNGNWFIRTVDGEVLAQELQWGGGGMEPVVGDYEGNGVWDLGLFAPLTGTWYIRSLNDGVFAWQIGMGFWRPQAVPGDYDGDGAFNPALYDQYDPEDARWYVARLEDPLSYPYLGFQYGWERAVPISLTRHYLPIRTEGEHFLYKPRTWHETEQHWEGKVVLLPSRMRPDGSTPVHRAVISKDPMGTTIMEELNYTGDHGTRPKWRWSQADSTFGYNFYVVAFFQQGGPPQPYLIFDGTKRQE